MCISRLQRVMFGPLIVAGVLCVVGGCNSDSKPVSAPPAQPESSSSSSAMTSSSSGTATPIAAVGDMQKELVASQQQIDAIILSMNQLGNADQSELRAAYDKYCDQLSRMSAHEYTLQQETAAMRASRDAYFAKWEANSADINNPTIRTSAEARQKRLRKAHERLVSESGAVRDAYVPFMRDLQDIKKYLANDLTKSSVADLQDAMKKVNTDSVVVKEKISTLVNDLNTIQGGGE